MGLAAKPTPTGAWPRRRRLSIHEAPQPPVSSTKIASARILGVDVARFGDDQSVIFPRQGRQAYPPLKFRNFDGIQGAGAVARKVRQWGIEAIFVDDTGGFGASWIDHMRLLGLAPIGIGFASRPNDPRYANKRSEMYFEAIEWIRRGGVLPDSPELIAALSQTTYTFQGDRLLLEPKEQIKARLGYSPDEADAFALTFAHPVSAAWGHASVGRTVEPDYDPLKLWE